MINMEGDTMMAVDVLQSENGGKFTNAKMKMGYSSKNDLLAALSSGPVFLVFKNWRKQTHKTKGHQYRQRHLDGLWNCPRGLGLS